MNGKILTTKHWGKGVRLFLFPLGLWGAAWILPGCAMADSTSMRPCADNLDCTLIEECVNHMCQPLPTVHPISLIDIELTPLKGQEAAPTQIPALDLETVPDLYEIPLEANPLVSFTGFIDSAFPSGKLSGTLEAKRSPQIDSRHLTFSATVSEEGRYEAGLAPGTYEFLFKPLYRGDIPQLQVTGVSIDKASAADNPPVITFPAYPESQDIKNQTSLLLLQGRILSSEVYPHPVAGIKVEGIAETGLHTNLATPDSTGVFYLRLPVELLVDNNPPVIHYPSTMDLIIKPDSSESRLPTITKKSIQLKTYDLGTFYMGEIPKSHVVSGKVLGPYGDPVPKCPLSFVTQKLGNGAYNLQIQADMDGNFSTTLPAGTYQVTAVPDPSSEAGLDSVSLEINADIHDKLITLPRRISIQGMVYDNSGKPVPDVKVQLERFLDENEKEDGISRTFEATSTSNGIYELEVDTGIYRLVAIPAVASRLPRTFPRPLKAKTAQDQIAQNIHLSQPAIIEGHVYSSVGQPLCGVTVVILYSTVSDAFQIGQTLSGGISEDPCTGSYAAVIPGGF